MSLMQKKVGGALVLAMTAVFGCGDDSSPLPPVTFDAGCRDCAPPVACEAPENACDGACVDLSRDPMHCGSCNTSCGEGGSCNAGMCRCGAGTSLCSSMTGVEQCADLTTDAAHCGACGTRCPAGASCVDGACACPTGRVSCEAMDGRATCVDLATSVLHCGTCGAACASTFDCVDGTCGCAADRTLCTAPDRCADLASDEMHCGTCGNACGAGQVCEAGRCVGACAAGDVCTTTSDCRTGAPAMLPETAGAFCVGEAREMVTVDDVSWTEVRAPGGYCFGSVGYASSAGTCERGTGNGCDACALCVLLGIDPVNGPIDGCAQRCTLTPAGWDTTRSGCREGHQCELVDQVCLPGCSSDEQCRATWNDLDGDGMHGDGETTYDASSSARCDAATGRCVDLPFDPTARVGDPCANDRECGRDGWCIVPWPGGGYCSKRACALPGRECEAPSVCQTAHLHRYGGCLAPCVFGDETDPSQILGAGGGDPDCRVPGYQCLAVGGSAFGGCAAGSYSDVTTPNVGAPCTSNADCYSPYGVGGCATIFGVGYCALYQCAASPFGHAGGTRSELCPEGTVCVGDPRTYSQCLRSCDPAMAGADCPAGHVCHSMGDPRTPVCFPRCRGDSDCGGRDRCLEGICRLP